MTPDLFSPEKSKKEQLYDFIKSKGRVRTSEVIKWGTECFDNRSDRNARLLAEEGKIWRMREDIKRAVYGETKEDIWSVYPADREYA